MARNIEPLKSGGQPSLPLSHEPFNSRVESEISFEGGDGTKPKNYQSVAFRPGFPLQASELNEIQEHYQMQMTLSLNMMNNWITSGAGPMWYGNHASLPGDGVGIGDVADGTIANTGIGIGGAGDAGGHNEQFAISGPGWRGATPLWPFICPYVPTPGSIGAELVKISMSGNVLTVQFNSGWYLVDLPLINPDSGDTPLYNGISGLKHWVYLDTSFAGNVTDAQYTVSLNLDNYDDIDIDIPVGLNISTSYVDCHCTETGNCDEDLGDNAAGYSNPVACGASRYAVNVVGVDSVSKDNWPSSSGAWDSSAITQFNKLSLVCKVNPSRKTVRYMNNIILHSWT
jgi:hypothetical protein